MNPYHSPLAQAFSHPALADLSFPSEHQIHLSTDRFASLFNLTDLATASISTASATLCRLHASRLGTPYPAVDSEFEINQRLVNLWFGFSIKPTGFSLPNPWDEIAGDYKAKDGWIRLHTNAAHHKRAALKVLQCENSRDAVTAAVAQWPADRLESAIVDAQGCAAKMYSIEQWQSHPQGKHLQKAALVDWGFHSSPIPQQGNLNTSKAPLAGIKVLDLTRVLAGPIATRFLAAFGAQVLRLDPLEWSEPSIVPEVTLGKRCAALDLKSDTGKQQLIKLLKSADVLVHGYRADALEKLGFSTAQIRTINPRLICASLNAYGWQGPWKNRRGFDSLLQMSTGIAHYAMQRSNASHPVPLPVQGLDHATGYLLAATVIQGIELREQQGIITRSRCSLASTAKLLIDHSHHQQHSLLTALKNPPARAEDFSVTEEMTSWGNAQRLNFPVQFKHFDAQWQSGACELHSHPPQWLAS